MRLTGIDTLERNKLPTGYTTLAEIIDIFWGPSQLCFCSSIVARVMKCENMRTYVEGTCFICHFVPSLL